MIRSASGVRSSRLECAGMLSRLRGLVKSFVKSFDNFSKQKMKTLLVLQVLFMNVAVCLGQMRSAASPLYLDPSQPIETRVNDLLSRMTLEEKASQLVNQSRGIPRLQLPEYDWRSEALHGIAGAGVATVFPEPIAIAASFDTPLV